MINPVPMPPPDLLVLVRLPVVCERMGCSRSALYRFIAAGLAPRPIKIGISSVWPAHEIQQVIAARIAGQTDGEIGALVAKIHASRATGGVVAVNEGSPEANGE